MTQRLIEPAHLQARETARGQADAMKDAMKGRLAWNMPDPADADYCFVPGRLLWSQDDQGRVDGALERRSKEFARIGTLHDADVDDDSRIDNLVVKDLGPPRRRGAGAPELRKYRDHGDPALEAMLAIFDGELGEGVVTPEHVLYVANGDGSRCPATEPEETGLKGPWPPKVDAAHASFGKNVRVAVIDTGWDQDAGKVQATKYLKTNVDGEPETRHPNGLALYEGHGTFIAGVIRCRAPQARIKHYSIGTGVAVSERVMVRAIIRALEDDPAMPPHIINLSAGCHTRRDSGLKTFQQLWKDHLSTMPGTILIAAAGNDASSLPFYPAARDWAIGVGSLDHKGAVSSFSNYGDSADIYVLGRNHINAFPKGTYICKEAPNTGDEREFTNGLARWSGTSFAAPLFAGLVAANLGPNPGTRATDVAKTLIRNKASSRPDPVYGQLNYIQIKDDGWRTNKIPPAKHV